MALPRKTLQRILSRISQDEILSQDPAQCWNWTGAHSLKRDGVRRPVMKVAGKVVSVARTILQLCGQYPLDGQEAGHTCPNGENANCIRPTHLQWMTRVENEQHKRTYKE